MTMLDTTKTLELTITVYADGFVSLDGSMINEEGTLSAIGEYSGSVERFKKFIEYYIDDALALGLMLTDSEGGEI